MRNKTKLVLLCASAALLTAFSGASLGARTIAPVETAASVAVKYQDWKDPARNRSIPVKIYMPKAAGDAYLPVLIFSHGLGGSREAAQYLGEYLAGRNYICVHIQHPGSDTEIAKNAVRKGRLNFRNELSKAITGENLILRVQDVSFVIDELERRSKTDPLLANRIDLTKIAVAGHSFGAGTALAACGQNYGTAARPKTMTDPRIKAGIYLSAPANLRGRSLNDAFGQIKVPGLLMTGTEDSSPIGHTRVEDRKLPFEGITAPHQYLVNFIGGDHAIFGGRSFRPKKASDADFHKQINQIAGAFLDAYLLDDKNAKAWVDGNGAKTYFAKTAYFERK